MDRDSLADLPADTRRHLATTDTSIHRIARLAGCDSQASLSKAFKREFGIAPGRHRTRTLSARQADLGS